VYLALIHNSRQDEPVQPRQSTMNWLEITMGTYVVRLVLLQVLEEYIKVIGTLVGQAGRLEATHWPA